MFLSNPSLKSQQGTRSTMVVSNKYEEVYFRKYKR
jgi:hypothetical protein